MDHRDKKKFLCFAATQKVNFDGEGEKNIENFKKIAKKIVNTSPREW